VPRFCGHLDHEKGAGQATATTRYDYWWPQLETLREVRQQPWVHLRIQMRPALRWEQFVEGLFALARDGHTDERGMPDPTMTIELLRKFPREIAPSPPRHRPETFTRAGRS
jgi:hypothetical protein